MTHLTDLSHVKEPLGTANGLPNAHYIDPTVFAEERDALIFSQWAGLAVGADVPEAGDAKPITFMGMPLLLLRDRNDQVRVFQNTCRHRGMILVEEPRKIEGAIRCPYHSWCYSTEGKLVSTPHVGGPGQNTHPDVDRSTLGLTEIRSHLWRDVVWVNVDGQAPEFETAMKPVMDRWAEFERPLYHGGEDSKFTLSVKSNWKLAVENYCESYHLPWVHPELNRVSNIKDHYHIEDPQDTFSGQGSNKYSQQFDGNKKFECFPNWPSDLHHNSEYVSLFPNVMLGIHVDHYYAFWLEPLANNKTREHFEMYYVGDESASSEDLKEMREKNFKFWQEVMNEDVNAIEGMQEGRKSPAYNGGNFSPIMDTPTLMFHKWVANNLTK